MNFQVRFYKTIFNPQKVNWDQVSDALGKAFGNKKSSE